MNALESMKVSCEPCSDIPLKFLKLQRLNINVLHLPNGFGLVEACLAANVANVIVILLKIGSCLFEPQFVKNILWEWAISQLLLIPEW